MHLRRAAFIALALLAAQFGPPPQQGQAAAPDPFANAPAPGQAAAPDPFSAPPTPGQPPLGVFGPAQPQQQPPPCVQEFMKLRGVTEQKAKAIQAASKRKPSPKEACGLFNVFSAAEAKLVKYAVDNKTTCNIPADIIDQMKKGHAKTENLRTKICEAAAAPPRPRGPSLSDTLTAPVPDANNIRTGKGTFDTLTGSPVK